MGMSYYVYVGAYLKIEAEKVEYMDGPFCPNGHGRMGGEFCSKCGGKMEKQKQLRAAWLWDLTEREDELAQLNGEYGPQDDVILAIGNQSQSLPDHICHLDTNELDAKGLAPKDIPVMIANFQKNYAEIIEELRQVAQVSVHFGVITYVM